MSPLTFLDLPGEIRNQIYYLLLVIPRLPSSRVYLLDRDPPIYPQILSVCRKVHDEAEQILYGSNVFVAELNFLVGLPRLRWEYPTIKSSRLISIINKYFIAVSSLDSPAFTCVEIKDAFSGMEELTIWAVRPYLLSRYFMLRYFEGVRGVKKAKIGGCVPEVPAYVEWLQEVMTMPKGIDIAPFERKDDEDVQELVDMN